MIGNIEVVMIYGKHISFVAGFIPLFFLCFFSFVFFMRMVVVCGIPA